MVDARSQLVFPGNWGKWLIKKHDAGDFIKFKYSQKQDKVEYKNKTMYGKLANIGLWAIFYAYTRKAANVSVVGIDGYTLYSKKQLDNKEASQHCFGIGSTMGLGFKGKKNRRGDNKYDFKHCRQRDSGIKKQMEKLNNYIKKRYKCSIEIITPTVYEKFYNPSVLNIKKKK